jgi:hypothetical protein
MIATPSISSSEMQDYYDAGNSRMFSAALIVLQFHLAQKSLQRGEQPHKDTTTLSIRRDGYSNSFTRQDES